MAGDQWRGLPRRELGVDFLGQVSGSSCCRRPISSEMSTAESACTIAQLFDLGLKLGQRLFKFQKCICACSVVPQMRLPRCASVLNRCRFQTAP